MKKTPHLLLIFILSSFISFAQNITISGYVSDIETGERLIGATIYDKEDRSGAITNNYGFYSITKPAGNVELIFSFLGYEKIEIKIPIIKDQQLNIALNPNNNELDEVVVNSSSNKVNQTQMSLLNLSVAKMEKIPVIMGEPDILKVIQLLPGVQSGTEGTSGIYVRGGSSDQNLFLMDGVPVYNANHLLGLFSTFNSNALKSVKLYKAGFPSRFGGRLSSVVDITMKDGNMKELKGDFSIGLLSSRLMLEGPIIKDKTSFMVSARRSYADLIAKPFIEFSERNKSFKTNFGLYFYDFNVKLNHIFSERSRLYWSLYSGKDKFAIGSESDNAGINNEIATISNKDEIGIGWFNTVSSLRWNYLLSNKLFSNTTFSYSKFGLNFGTEFIYNYIEEDYTNYYYNNYFSGIEDLAAKIDFDYFPSQKHSIKFGISETIHKYICGDSINEIDNTSKFLQEVLANELSAYIEDELSITDQLSMNLGVHLSLFQVNNVDYFRPQPRISMHYKAFENLSFNASLSRMVQHIHLLSTSGISMPTDLWVPVSKKFEPPISDQLAIATIMNLHKGYNLTIECFYKNMHNLIEYKEGSSFSGNGTSWEDNVEKGNGWSYGAEFLFEKNIGKTSGWISYTWSKSERQFENINYGKVFPYKYDRRHDLSVVVNHRFNEKIDIGATWVYKTGNTATVSFTQYPFQDIEYHHISGLYNLYNYSGRNNYRLPNYHRLDIGVNLHKNKKHGVRTWSFSVYNAYNQQNVFMLTWSMDDADIYQNEYGVRIQPSKLYKFTLFPIIPSVSYSFKF